MPQEVADQRRRKLRDEARDKGCQVSARRLALAAWAIFITNAPAELVSLEAGMVLGRVRWQIELLFKLWKSHGHIDESRSTKPWRILCDVYAIAAGDAYPALDRAH
ncbi:MAG: transposase [Herpetosiphonaceae bacterium]|nr:transposase [Herpetosiphonaceae bacterium]